MFAYIKENKIAFISTEKLGEEFLQNLKNHQSYSEKEYDEKTIKNPIVSESGEIIEAPKIETQEEKFERIFSILANPENDLETKKLEWVKFNDKQIGDLIQARVFNNNPHSQMAMQAKFSAWIGSVIMQKPNIELKSEIDEKQAKINEVRVFFGLPPLTM